MEPRIVERPGGGWIAGMVTIEIAPGDITESECEGIVNAANNHFWMGGGVAGAIKRKGGTEIETEAVAKGPVKPGESVVTGAGRLKARYVIHAATMGQDLSTDARLIEKATASAFGKADSIGITSLAYPALGTGVGGFSVEDAGEIMMSAVAAIALGSPPPLSVRLVRFILLGDVALTQFRSGAERAVRGFGRC